LSCLREGLDDVLGAGGAVGDALADEVRKRLDPTMLARLVEPVARLLADDSDGVALAGDLKKVPIAEVLGLLASQRQWGVLTVVRGGVEPGQVELGFKNGKIELALAE